MSLHDLKPGGLYIHLTYRDEPPPEDVYHWGLYLHVDTEKGGTKYHITNESSGWIADHGVTTGAFKSSFLVGMIRTADVPAGRLEGADRIIRSYDTTLNNIGKINCRQWVLRIMVLLQEEGILRCQNLDTLEWETLNWSNEHQFSAVLAKKPRPITDSKLCEL